MKIEELNKALRLIAKTQEQTSPIVLKIGQQMKQTLSITTNW